MTLYFFFITHPVFFYVVATVLGLLVGSFLNVVIYRLPVMMERDWRSECQQYLGIRPEEKQEPSFNLMVPRSRCPNCNHPISAVENIPVLSYVFLGGKCRECRTRISLRYPAVEIVTGTITLVMAMHFGVTLQTLLAVILGWSLITLTLIDYDHQLLPDSITLPVMWLGILSNTFGLFTSLHSSLYGAVAGYMVLWTVYIVFKLVTGKEGMGHGDFKLLAMLGAWMGWQVLPLTIVVSSLIGSIVGISLILFRGHSRAQPIPFGPYLAVAGLIAFLYGNELTRMYYDLILPECHVHGKSV